MFFDTAEIVEQLVLNPKWYAITDELDGYPFKNMRARNTGVSIGIVSHGATFYGLPIGDKWRLHRGDNSQVSRADVFDGRKLYG